MAKINQYPAKTVPSNNDEFVLHDPGSGSTKKMTRGDLIGGAPLPANSVNGQAVTDGSIAPAKLSFKAVRHLGTAKSNPAISLTTTYVTHGTVTAQSLGNECEAEFKVNFSNAASGQPRHIDVRIQCDGVDVTPANLRYTALNISGASTDFNASFLVSSAPSAGSHTWTLQVRASAASSVTLSNTVLRVNEIVGS